jgi:hypothetical protein
MAAAIKKRNLLSVYVRRSNGDKFLGSLVRADEVNVHKKKRQHEKLSLLLLDILYRDI